MVRHLRDWLNEPVRTKRAVIPMNERFEFAQRIFACANVHAWPCPNSVEVAEHVLVFGREQPHGDPSAQRIRLQLRGSSAARSSTRHGPSRESLSRNLTGESTSHRFARIRDSRRTEIHRRDSL